MLKSLKDRKVTEKIFKEKPLNSIKTGSMVTSVKVV